MSFGGAGVTPAVKLLLIVNVAVFLIVNVAVIALDPFLESRIFMRFGLVPSLIWNNLYLWQLFTYQFLHGGLFHILFNMLALWMFGCNL